MSVRTPTLPTDLDDWRLVGRVVGTVLAAPLYAALALFVALVGLSTFVLSQNVPLFRDVILGGRLPPIDRLEILIALYPVVGTAYDGPTAVVLLSTAALFGINVATLAFYLRRSSVGLRGGSGSLLGVTFGTMGAGCAACGSVVLTGVFSLFGITGVLAVLPLDGLEFALLALATLLLSIYWLADGVRGGDGEACPVDPDR